jgi:hypothetical protein
MKKNRLLLLFTIACAAASSSAQVTLNDSVEAFVRGGTSATTDQNEVTTG